jgi:hypothetical protein
MSKENTPQNYTMEKFEGGSVEVHAWWTPETKGATLKGVLIGFISQDKSDKLKSDMLVFELLEDLAKCKDAENTEKIITAKKGQNVAMSYYAGLQGLYPQKLGHVCHLQVVAEKKIPGQSPMKMFEKQTSTKPVRAIAKPESSANGASSDGPVPFEA